MQIKRMLLIGVIVSLAQNTLLGMTLGHVGKLGIRVAAQHYGVPNFLTEASLTAASLMMNKQSEVSTDWDMFFEFLTVNPQLLEQESIQTTLMAAPAGMRREFLDENQFSLVNSKAQQTSSREHRRKLTDLKRAQNQSNYLLRSNENVHQLRASTRNVLDYYNEHKSDSTIVPWVTGQVQSGLLTPTEILYLTDELSNPHFVDCYDAVSNHLLQSFSAQNTIAQRAQELVWKKLEPRLMKLYQHASTYKALCYPEQMVVSARWHEIYERKNKASNLVTAYSELKKKKVPNKIVGNQYDVFLKNMRDVRSNPLLVLDLEHESAGITQKLFRKEADIAYRKMLAALEAGEKSASPQERLTFLDCANRLEPHLQTAEFKELLVKRGNHSFESFNNKVLESLQRQKIGEQYSMSFECLQALMQDFDIKSKRLMTVPEDYAQAEVLRGCVSLMTFVSKEETQDFKSIIGDFIDFKLEQMDKDALNTQAQIESVKHAISFLGRAAPAAWNEGCTTAVAILAMIPVKKITDKVLSATKKIPYLRRAALLGTMLYNACQLPQDVKNICQLPKHIKTELTAMGDAISQDNAEEFGRAFERLGANTLFGMQIAKHMKITLSEAHKNGFLKDALNVLKKGAKSQSGNAKDLKSAYEAIQPRIVKLNKIHGQELVQNAQRVLGREAVVQPRYVPKIKVVINNIKTMQSDPRTAFFLHEGGDKNMPITAKSYYEALAAMAAEKQNFLQNLTRSGDRSFDFRDHLKRAWDTKRALSRRPNTDVYDFNAEQFNEKIMRELRADIGALIDITELEQQDLTNLLACIQKSASLDQQKNIILLHRELPLLSKVLGQ